MRLQLWLNSVSDCEAWLHCCCGSCSLILPDVLQVEELALNSMIRKSNSDVRLQTDKKSQESAKTHVRRKKTEVAFYLWHAVSRYWYSTTNTTAAAAAATAVAAVASTYLILNWFVWYVTTPIWLKAIFAWWLKSTHDFVIKKQQGQSK